MLSNEVAWQHKAEEALKSATGDSDSGQYIHSYVSEHKCTTNWEDCESNQVMAF